MLNERDDKFDNQDDTQYHFSDSDEEISYEVEGEPAKAATTETSKAASGGNVFPKRMIFVAIFIGLVFLVYKMVAPGSQAPSTDIMAPAPLAQHTAPAMQAKSTQQTMSPMPTQPTVASSSPQSNVVPVPTAPPTSMPVVTPPEVPTEANAASTPSMTPTNTATPPVMASMPSSSQGTPSAMPNLPPIAQPQAPQTVATMPAVIPVQSTTVPLPSSASSYTPTQAQNIITSTESIDNRIKALAYDNEKMMNQLQSDYLQKLNDFQTLNKALQDQIQTLNTRVSTMETQVSQLVQTLSHQAQANSTPAPSSPPNGIEPQLQVQVQSQASPPTPNQASSSTAGNEGAAEDKTSNYNVQAIIPGRAWLRADNGETVTVAEGDVVKDLGRVTKIDPYDGVVQINTGNKVITLSYGTSS